MKMTRHLTMLALTFALMSCTSLHRIPSDARVPDDVRAAMLALQAADQNLDAEGVIALLAPDFLMYQDGTRRERDDVVTQIRATLPTLQSFETDFENIEVIVLAHDAALVSMTFRDRIVDASGNVLTARGPSTFLWRHRAGAWQIAYLDADHYSE